MSSQRHFLNFNAIWLIKINISMVPHLNLPIKKFEECLHPFLNFSCLKLWTKKGFWSAQIKKKWINTVYLYQDACVVNHNCSNLQQGKIIFEDFSLLLWWTSPVTLSLVHESWCQQMGIYTSVTRMFVVICSVYLKFLKVFFFLYMSYMYIILYTCIFLYALLFQQNSAVTHQAV